MIKGLSKFLLCVYLLQIQTAFAEIDIVITSGMTNARPVAILPFSWKGMDLQPSEDVAAVIAADLRRSGRFNPMARNLLLQQVYQYKDVNLPLWREKGIEAVVVGTIEQQPDGQLKIGYELVDVFQREQEVRNGELITANRNRLDAYSTIIAPENLRFQAHRIADRIYELLTGEKGAFATRIAYVSVDKSQTKPYALMIADSDGYAPQTLFESYMPLMSPAWSPNAQQMAYVSFENGRSEVFIQDIYKVNSRRRVAAFAAHLRIHRTVESSH
jgi:TolB protein